MNHTDFAALLSELPEPVAACLARCRVASIGRFRAKTRRRIGFAPYAAGRHADLSEESRAAIALARRYRSQPVDVSGVVLSDGWGGAALRHWARYGCSAYWSLPEYSIVRVERHLSGQFAASLFIGVADKNRSQIVREQFAASMADAERTARRWAACAAAVLAVRPYLPEDGPWA